MRRGGCIRSEREWLQIGYRLVEEFVCETGALVSFAKLTGEMLETAQLFRVRAQDAGVALRSGA